MPTAVTDPDLLSQLESKPAGKPVTDPDLLKQLEAAPSGGITEQAGKFVKGVGRGAVEFAGQMGEAVAGPFGPSGHAANLMATIRGERSEERRVGKECRL